MLGRARIVAILLVPNFKSIPYYALSETFFLGDRLRLGPSKNKNQSEVSSLVRNIFGSFSNNYLTTTHNVW